VLEIGDVVREEAVDFETARDFGMNGVVNQAAADAAPACLVQNGDVVGNKDGFDSNDFSDGGERFGDVFVLEFPSARHGAEGLGQGMRACYGVATGDEGQAILVMRIFAMYGTDQNGRVEIDHGLATGGVNVFLNGRVGRVAVKDFDLTFFYDFRAFGLRANDDYARRCREGEGSAFGNASGLADWLCEDDAVGGIQRYCRFHGIRMALEWQKYK
jgi:hypothetical protein